MKNNTLKYCLYYKGEEISPYNYDTPENSFWYLERQYWIDPSFNNKESHELFEGMASKYISEHPNEKNFMTSSGAFRGRGAGASAGLPTAITDMISSLAGIFSFSRITSASRIPMISVS